VLIIGLTGGIASGKTSVAEWFRARGVTVADADKIVHRLYEQDRIIDQVEKEFGSGYIAGGKIDRIQLGKLVFSDPAAKHKLEKIIHPYVWDEITGYMKKAREKGERVLILDIPLLYETGWDKHTDEVWVVYAPQEVQAKRLAQRNKIAEEEALKRIASQMPMQDKLARADRVINNAGAWADTEAQLFELWEEIQKKM
jgi:dephospho-CoA kinase